MSESRGWYESVKGYASRDVVLVERSLDTYIGIDETSESYFQRQVAALADAGKGLEWPHLDAVEWHESYELIVTGRRQSTDDEKREFDAKEYGRFRQAVKTVEELGPKFTVTEQPSSTP